MDEPRLALVFCAMLAAAAAYSMLPPEPLLPSMNMDREPSCALPTDIACCRGRAGGESWAWGDGGHESWARSPGGPCPQTPLAAGGGRLGGGRMSRHE